MVILVAYLLDLLLGDPRWLPHPIRLYGHLISFGEKHLNKGPYRVLKGACMTIILCTATYFVFHYIPTFLAPIFVFYALANKSLLQEGKEVFDTLHDQGLEAGRKRLSWIVGYHPPE